MRPSNYNILTVIGIVATVLMPIAPCRGEWIWIGSEVASGPTYGSGGDSYHGWEFEVSNINTSANSSGASASADCEASIWIEVYTSSGTVSRSKSPWCSSWGKSYYIDDDPPNPLYISWSIDGSGTVQVAGEVVSCYFAEGDSGDSSASAYGEIEGFEYGYAYACGSVSEDSNGSAYVGTGGYAEENGSPDVDNGEFEYYQATLSYSVEGSDSVSFDGEDEDYITQFTAAAEVSTSASASASVTVTPGYFGDVWATSDASASGSASVSVSW